MPATITALSELGMRSSYLRSRRSSRMHDRSTRASSSSRRRRNRRPPRPAPPDQIHERGRVLPGKAIPHRWDRAGDCRTTSPDAAPPPCGTPAVRGRARGPGSASRIGIAVSASNCTGASSGCSAGSVGNGADVGEEDVGGPGGAEQPCGRRVQVAQQSVADPVVRHRLQRVRAPRRAAAWRRSARPVARSARRDGWW